MRKGGERFTLTKHGGKILFPVLLFVLLKDFLKENTDFIFIGVGLFFIFYLFFALPFVYRSFLKEKLDSNIKGLKNYALNKEDWTIYQRINFLLDLLFFDVDILKKPIEKLVFDRKVFNELHLLNLGVSEEDLSLVLELYDLKLHKIGETKFVKFHFVETCEIGQLYSSIIASFRKFSKNESFKNRK